MVDVISVKSDIVLAPLVSKWPINNVILNSYSRQVGQKILSKRGISCRYLTQIKI